MAHTASCASLQFASGLENFLKQYQKKSKVVSAGPSAESLPGLTKWLGKVTTFFQWAAHQWGAIGHSAPSSVKSIYGRTTTTLNEVASDFSSANKAGKAGNLSALEKDVLRAEKHAGQFETAAAKLAKACV